MLDKEFKYYVNNQRKLVAKYDGKYLVIKGEEVIGSYDSEDQASFETKKEHETGTFLIQYCEKGKASNTQSFHSRVAFLSDM